MTEENLTIPANPTSGNTFTLNATTAHTTYNPAGTAAGTVTWPYYPGYTYTTGYLYAQLSEQQLADLEGRFRKVLRAEWKALLSQVLTTLEDEDSEDEDA